jgi:hypothetical protein
MTVTTVRLRYDNLALAKQSGGRDRPASALLPSELGPTQLVGCPTSGHPELHKIPFYQLWRKSGPNYCQLLFSRSVEASIPALVQHLRTISDRP